jgi:hypothetical protein
MHSTPNFEIREKGLDAQPILAASPAILCRTKKEERVIHNE